MPDRIDPEDVQAKRENGGVQIVDVRDESDYADGHIPEARNLPLEDFEDLVEDVEWGDDIVVACYVGETSVQASRLLEAHEGVPDDADVASMDGGYEAWEFALERDADADAEESTA